ncbi:MAG TPA: crosslink repair DNA glycosylase YcaQ family protein [Kofleriaceae bacterium]|nr:crosslink repair DNA glycosylase YcaQ family protein [Kofleriaceae bacterium]
MADSLSLAQARALWWQKQALGSSDSDELGARIARSGWLRTLGGADVYLAARARKPGMHRRELDEVVERGELRVIPAARGCIYLVPPAVVSDLMALNADAWRKQTEKDLAKAGSTIAVVEEVAANVLAALTGPMTTDAIRKAMPADTIPSFGESGKKAGLSSPLPLALRWLELEGRIERTLDHGKLDTDRYLWRRAAWEVPPAAANPVDQLANVIGAFLDFAGPATLGHLASWSGRAQRDLRPALDKLGAKPVSVDGVGESWIRPGEIGAAMRAFEPRGVVLLAFEDNYLVNHGGLAAVTDPKHHAIEIDIWGSGKPEAIGKANHVLSRTIVIDGLVEGFWEVDPKTEGAVWHTFEPANAQLASRLDDLTADAAKFLFGEIGHARTFSLDSMDEVQARADRIARMRAGKPPLPIEPKAKPMRPIKVKPAEAPAPKAVVAPPPPKPVAKPVAKPAAKPAAKQPPAKKPAAKKPAAKKPAAKKPAAKKSKPAKKKR